MQTPRGGSRASTKNRYRDLITAFDIETTSIPAIEQSFMYIWQYQIEEDTIIGRTWEDFIYFCRRVQKATGIAKLVTFVHNLSYEFQFLKGIYDFTAKEVFAVQRRKILKCSMFGAIEFRCSYKHSNMSLEAYLKKMGVEHEKIKGFDYSKIRYPWTALTDEELDYCINDVRGLVEAIKIDIKIENDDLYTFPLTSTGYVRRRVKKSMESYSHSKLQDMLPSFSDWVMLREAFRGGNTHANRYYANACVHNVISYDRVSSYPEVMLTKKFPMSKFQDIEDLSWAKYKLLIARERAILMRVSISDLKLKDERWGCPYLTVDKCRNTIDYIADNGRILEAKYLETSITDIDFNIICEEYEFLDCKILGMKSAIYDYLPEQIRKVLKELFYDKTKLKVSGDTGLYYALIKAMINGEYGMIAQNPCIHELLFRNGDFYLSDESDEEALARHSKGAFLCYQWGVWVTAWARRELEEGMKIAGHDFLYADTDSVKFMVRPETVRTICARFEKYNSSKIRECEETGAYVEIDGKRYYLGIYEEDAIYRRFLTMGAKKYAYEDISKKLHITIAGVNKRLGAIELAKRGGIGAMKEGFIFYEAGGLESKFNDIPAVREYNAEGRKIPITSNIYMCPSTYQLGLTSEYRYIIEKAKNTLIEIGERY